MRAARRCCPAGIGQMNLQQTHHTRGAQVSLNNPHHDVAFPTRTRLQLASVPARATAVMSVCDLLLPKETFTAASDGHCRRYLDATRSMPLASMTATPSSRAWNQ